MEPTTDSSREIVRRSGSNLAIALAVLPRDKRDDMQVFYAFCRIVDDIADDPGYTPEERVAGLNRWRDLIHDRESSPHPGVESEFLELKVKYALDRETLEAIVDGMAMDIDPPVIATRAELQRYCYHAASAVGLISIEIFGYEDGRTKVYAEQLGYALQWTNILRDVGEDADEGRVYLAEEDLARFGLSRDGLLKKQVDPESFRALMEDQAAVAQDFYAKAVAALPEVDRRSMRSAELMRRIYSSLLARMKEGGFEVLDHRYRLSKKELAGYVMKAKLGL